MQNASSEAVHLCSKCGRPVSRRPAQRGKQGASGGAYKLHYNPASWPKQAAWEDLTPWPAEASMLSRPAQPPFSPFLDSRNELEVLPEPGGYMYQKTLTFSFLVRQQSFYDSVRTLSR